MYVPRWKDLPKIWPESKRQEFPKGNCVRVSNRHELNACWVAKSPYVSYTTVFENISSFDSCEKSLLFLFHLLSSFHLASCLNYSSSVSPLNIGILLILSLQMFCLMNFSSEILAFCHCLS